MATVGILCWFYILKCGSFIDKKLSKADLRKATDIAPNTMTKLRRDEAVILAILGRGCVVLDCDISDIMKYIKDEKVEK